MRVVVTGTRRMTRLDAPWWMSTFCERRGVPDLWIFGDSYNWCPGLGVDGIATAWARAMGHQHKVERANPLLQSPHRFHERDQRMADHVGPGDFCLAFPDADSRGTYLTVRLCKARGATIAECPLREVRRCRG